VTSSAARVLVVEDESKTAEGLLRGMRTAGFTVELATSSDEGLRRTLAEPPDAIILDLNLPDQSGFEFLQRIQGRCTAPVLVLTARIELADRLKCFALGAVDYVAKPFFLEEIVARVRSRLRAHEAVRPWIVGWADVVVDLDRRVVRVADHDVAFTRSELDILAYLLERPGRVVSRADLAKQTALASGNPDIRTVDTHLARVRKKLGAAAAAIVTVWGIGYRFDPSDGAAA
jgi:DNA-binding response OmpR family regulator